MIFNYYDDKLSSVEDFNSIPTPIFDRGGKYRNAKDERGDRLLQTDSDGVFWKLYPKGQNYIVSEDGHVVNRKTLKELKGYGERPTVELPYQGKTSIGRMVLETFIGGGKGKFVKHINGNRSDNRLENLEWSDKRQRCMKSINA